MNFTKQATIDTTPWFKLEAREPGQPGVFEVDPAVIDCEGNTQPRFAYWNGKDFAATAQSAGAAFRARFNRRIIRVTKFRGLTEDAS